MCGILGYIAHGRNRPDVKRFKKSLEACSNRGHDATGIYSPEIGITKLDIEAKKFIEQFDNEITRTLQSQVVLAHCRATTRGPETENKNNHPHESENFILIHNGTIGRSEKIKDFPYRSDCDSEIILSYVEKYGVEEGITKMNEYDSMSIALYDKRTQEVFLFRNTNPAHILIDREKGITYFGSNLDILKPIVRMAPKYGWEVWDGFNSFDTEAKKLYKLNIAQGLVDYKEIKQTYFPPKSTFTDRRSHYGGHWDEGGGFYSRNNVGPNQMSAVRPFTEISNIREKNDKNALTGTRKIIYRGGCPRIIVDNFSSALI
jgi:hypothetical protein